MPSLDAPLARHRRFGPRGNVTLTFTGISLPGQTSGALRRRKQSRPAFWPCTPSPVSKGSSPVEGRRQAGMGGPSGWSTGLRPSVKQLRAAWSLPVSLSGRHFPRTKPGLGRGDAKHLEVAWTAEWAPAGSAETAPTCSRVRRGGMASATTRHRPLKGSKAQTAFCGRPLPVLKGKRRPVGPMKAQSLRRVWRTAPSLSVARGQSTKMEGASQEKNKWNKERASVSPPPPLLLAPASRGFSQPRQTTPLSCYKNEWFRFRCPSWRRSKALRQKNKAKGESGSGGGGGSQDLVCLGSWKWFLSGAIWGRGSLATTGSPLGSLLSWLLWKKGHKVAKEGSFLRAVLPQILWEPGPKKGGGGKNQP